MGIAIITGASSGLGREFALLVQKRKNIDTVWLIARREERLHELNSDLTQAEGSVIPLDLSCEEDIEEFRNILKKRKPRVEMLINNAGFALYGFSDSLPLEEQLSMMKVNNLALVAVTHLVLPYMERGGEIIQVSSAMAFLPFPKFSVYSATKAFVLSYSVTLRAEIRPRGINVTALCPGPVRTEFFQRADAQSFFLRHFAFPPKLVARMGLFFSRLKRPVAVDPIIFLYNILARIVPKSTLFFLGAFRPSAEVPPQDGLSQED